MRSFVRLSRMADLSFDVYMALVVSTGQLSLDGYKRQIFLNAVLAQLVEQLFCKQLVTRSSRVPSSIIKGE